MSLCSAILGGRLRGLSKPQERQGEKNAWHAEKSKPCLSTPTGSGRAGGDRPCRMPLKSTTPNYAIDHGQRVLRVRRWALNGSMGVIFGVKIIQSRAPSYYWGKDICKLTDEIQNDKCSPVLESE